MNSKRVICFLILNFLLSSITFWSYSQQHDKSFDLFWAKFRNAVIANDYATLKSLTQFPLIVKGTLDSDPIKKYKNDQFIFIFKHYLKQSNTMEDILETEKVPDQIYTAESQTIHRLSDMQFKKVNGKWELVLIYIETLYQEENNIK
jgi:hypothetical protein